MIDARRHFHSSGKLRDQIRGVGVLLHRLNIKRNPSAKVSASWALKLPVICTLIEISRVERGDT